MSLRHVPRRTVADLTEGRRAERGETLIELLVMIVLMGVGFTAIFSGLMTVSRVNALNDKRTKASIGVQSWAEGLQQPATALTGSTTDPYTYKPCASPETYMSAGQPSGWLDADWRAKNPKPLKVEYFDGTFTASGEPNFNTDQNACYTWMFSHGAHDKDRGLQRITLKVETPTGVKPAVSDTLVILKRDQQCPAVSNTDGSSRFDNADLGPC